MLNFALEALAPLRYGSPADGRTPKVLRLESEIGMHTIAELFGQELESLEE